MRSAICFFIIIIMVFFVVGFSYEKDINYYETEGVITEDLDVIFNNREIKDITGCLSYVEVSESEIKAKKYFIDERYVLKKYNSEAVVEIIEQPSLDKIVLNGKEFKGIYGFEVFDEESTSITDYCDSYLVIYNDNSKNIIVINYYDEICVYNPINKKIKSLINTEGSKIIHPEHIEEYRLLDVKGEWFLVLGVYHDPDYKYKEFEHLHRCFRLYRYNILNNEVTIWDSHHYGLNFFASSYCYLNYDISISRRYIYMSFIDEGIYAYDWWEGNIYKIFGVHNSESFKSLVGLEAKLDSSTYVNVLNDTEDGFLYIEEYQYNGKGEKITIYFKILTAKLEEVLSSYSEK